MNSSLFTWVGGDALRQAAEVFGHNAVIEGLQAGGLQRLAKPDQRGQAVQLAALFQGTAPGKDGGHGVGGGGLALEVLVVVAGHGAMGGLVLIVAVRADQNAGHHGQRAKGGGDHIAHHVAVVVLAGPDKAAPRCG